MPQNGIHAMVGVFTTGRVFHACSADNRSIIGVLGGEREGGERQNSGNTHFPQPKLTTKKLFDPWWVLNTEYILSMV